MRPFFRNRIFSDGKDDTNKPQTGHMPILNIAQLKENTDVEGSA
jgi:hypothetical protein